jgi:hypothetical protein
MGGGDEAVVDVPRSTDGGCFLSPALAAGAAAAERGTEATGLTKVVIRKTF